LANFVFSLANPSLIPLIFWIFSLEVKFDFKMMEERIKQLEMRQAKLSQQMSDLWIAMNQAKRRSHSSTSTSSTLPTSEAEKRINKICTNLGFKK